MRIRDGMKEEEEEEEAVRLMCEKGEITSRAFEKKGRHPQPSTDGLNRIPPAVSISYNADHPGPLGHGP